MHNKSGRRGVLVPPAQPLEIYTVGQPDSGRSVGTVAFCTRDEMKVATAISWKHADYSFLAPDEYVSEFIITGNILSQQRNECIQRLDGDWILFIDDDMAWQPSAIRQIVETQQRTGADVVGGLCFQRTAPHQPTLYISNKEGTGYTYHEKWEDGDVIDVDATGMAFCLITTQALTKIVQSVTGDPLAHFPSFEERKRIAGAPTFFQWDGRWGEDFGFCREAQRAGCRIVVDTGIEIGHIAERVVGKVDFWKEMFFRHEAAGEAKRAVADELGVTTISRQEALERIEAVMEAEVRQ